MLLQKNLSFLLKKLYCFNLIQFGHKQNYSVKRQPQKNKDSVERIIRDFPPPPHLQTIPPDWLAGFVNGDGCFCISFYKNNTVYFKISLRAQFSISQHQRSLYLLQAIKDSLGEGQLLKRRYDSWDFVVSRQSDLSEKVIPLFLLRGFLGKKHGDFLYFKAVVQSIVRKNHLSATYFWNLVQCTRFSQPIRKGMRTIEQFQEILNKHQGIQVQSNKIYSLIPWYPSFSKRLTSGYVCGITDAEGCFIVNIRNSDNHWPLIRVRLEFTLWCHPNSIQILQEVNNFFGECGYIINNRQCFGLIFSKFKVISEVIVPFFLLNPLLSSKYYDFLKFVEVAYLIKAKKHLTNSGMTKILKLAYGMNSGKEQTTTLRKYTYEKRLQYLQLAPTRVHFHKIKHSLPEIRKRMLQPIQTSKKNKKI
eukprot:TRINITY_DN29191_c0_g1_i1.p1 TRINITY_DN29191_c0_g1~~TRINITY_DN29191_c0_g1_i1.p1  ORF type:complete len:418 (-),score=-4.55 TRINITY_DN29191_c0_g1_i1:219-1472(-)